MQIEKPKSSLPKWVIVLAVVFGLGLVCLPFFAQTGKPVSSKKSSPSPVEPDTATAAARTVPQSNLVDPAALAQASEDAPDELPLDQKLDLTEVDLPAMAETVQSPDQPPVPEVPVQNKTEVASAPTAPAAALLTSFYGNVKVIGKDGEVKPERNKKILEGDTIEVGASGEAVIQIEELYVLRLKPNSSLRQEAAEVDKAYAGKERRTYHFRLNSGALLGTTRYRGDKISALKLLVQDKVFDVQDSTFRVQLTGSEPWVGVMRGSMKSDVENAGDQPIVIRALEKVAVSDQALQAPTKVSEAEWGLLRETYEMNVKTAAEEAMQMDLRMRAGNFFEYVFDHGTFYTEDAGYTVRDFYEDKESGEVYAEAEYDVFPPNSFVGIYVLTRDLDARNFSGIRFDVRRKPEEGYPDRFFVELKSKGQIIHRFEITDIKPNWETRQVDFFTPASTPITEFTIVFLNESIGQSKKGYIQMRRFEMVPLTEDQKRQRDEAVKNPQKAAIPNAATLKQAPKSVKQSVLTERIQKARTIMNTDGMAEVPYTRNESVKIANEVPKVVSLDDLS